MFIVIEGTDGSGKATQTAALSARLTAERVPHRTLTFPRYDSPHSSAVKAYLNGDFGTAAEAVSPYVSSSFYAVDRITSFLSDWKRDYDAGTLIISDRYTTSNAVHQGAKFADDNEREHYLNWLQEFEFGKLGLPKPDLVIFLDVPTATTLKLISSRGSTDIHEADAQYLAKSHDAALFAAKLLGWECVSCVDKTGSLLSVEQIHQQIYTLVKTVLTSSNSEDSNL